MNWGEETVRYLRNFLGTPYLWAGNNPVTGMDCGGFICEGLRFAGMIGFHEDLSSHHAFNRFMPSSIVCAPPFRPGTLLFFGKHSKIEHIAMASTGYHMIEAAGGNSNTVSKEIAGKFNAFVKERPWWYRTDFVVALYPPYPYIDANGQLVRPTSAKESNY